MKTKELVELISQLDPSGELEVTADGLPIYMAEKLPAYYDGSLQMLLQDKAVAHYNITGYKVTNAGNKVTLRTMDLAAVLSDNVNAPVDLSELEGAAKAWWEARVIETRENVRQIESELGEK